MIEYTAYEKNLMTIINHVAGLSLTSQLMVNDNGEQERVTQAPLDSPELITLWTKTLVTNNADQFHLHLLTEKSNRLYTLSITIDGVPLVLNAIESGSPVHIYTFNDAVDGALVRNAAIELAMAQSRIKTHMTRHIIKHTQKTSKLRR